MNKGVTIDGKLVRFKRKERTKGSVVGKKAGTGKTQSKPTKAKAVKTTPKAKAVKTGKELKAAEPGKPAEPSEAGTLQSDTTS